MNFLEMDSPASADLIGAVEVFAPALKLSYSQGGHLAGRGGPRRWRNSQTSRRLDGHG